MGTKDMQVEKAIQQIFKFVAYKGWKPYAAYYKVVEEFPTELSQENFSDMQDRFGYDEYWAIKQYETYSGKKSPLKEEYNAKMETIAGTDFTGDWFKWDKPPKDTPSKEKPPAEDDDLPF